MLRIALVSALVSSAAFAQIQLTFPSNATSASFSPASCSGRTTLSWTVPVIVQVCDTVEFFVTETACTDNGVVAGDYDLGTESVATTGVRTGTKTIDFNRLPGISGTADGGFFCGAPVEKPWRVCAVYEVNNPTGFGGFCTQRSARKDSVTLSYDGKPPAVPTLVEAVGVERGVRVIADVGEDADLVRFGTRRTGEDVPYTFNTEIAAEAASATTRITDLENGVQYDVVAVAVDQAGNVSAESNVIQAIPTETLGFWDAYKKAGGAEQGGCTSAPGLLSAAALTLAIWISRRKKS